MKMGVMANKKKILIWVDFGQTKNVNELKAVVGLNFFCDIFLNLIIVSIFMVKEMMKINVIYGKGKFE